MFATLIGSFIFIVEDGTRDCYRQCSVLASFARFGASWRGSKIRKTALGKAWFVVVSRKAGKTAFADFGAVPWGSKLISFVIVRAPKKH